MENVFNINCNKKMDKLEISTKRKKSKVITLVERNKFISLIFFSFIILSGINFYLIFNFMKILERI